MPSLYCEHCGYRIHVRAAELWLENCPRCAVRNKTLMPLAVSPSMTFGRSLDAERAESSTSRVSYPDASTVG